MHLLYWLLFGRGRRHDLRGHGNFMCVLSCGKLLCWWRRCSCGMHLLNWILFGCWRCLDVRWHGTTLYFLLSWQFVLRQRHPASGVHVYRGVRLHKRDIGRVCDYHGNLRGMPSWEIMRGCRSPAR